MKITFRPTNYETLEDCWLLAKWDSDPEIRHLAIPFKDEADYKNCLTAEQIQAERKTKSPYTAAVDLMILKDGRPVGRCSIVYNIPHRLTKEGKVAWFSVVIGEKKARGKGIGRKAREHLEKIARADGADCIETSAFEFNAVSLKLIRSMGYQEIGRCENITYWNGKYWADIRLVKKLKP